MLQERKRTSAFGKDREQTASQDHKPRLLPPEQKDSGCNVSSPVSKEQDPFIPTRESLLSRLKDGTHEGDWREFFETYWKLIYNAARRRGLTDTEAEDVVQETMVALVKNISKFEYDPKRGSFKNWLMNLTQWKIVDQFRKRDRAVHLDTTFDVAVDSEFEDRWSAEWHLNIASEAARRVKTKVSPRAFQAYTTNVVQGRGPRTTATLLKMSVPAVYMATFKVRKLLKAEALRLEKGKV